MNIFILFPEMQWWLSCYKCIEVNGRGTLKNTQMYQLNNEGNKQIQSKT